MIVLCAILLFVGLRGVPVRQAIAYCLITALLLTLSSVGAMDDQPACEGLGCSPSPSGIAFAFCATLALAFICYGAGIAVRWLFGWFKRA